MNDRERWNAKYRAGSHSSAEPGSQLVARRKLLEPPRPDATALDVAGGAGRHALWLAQLGYQVTLCDVSEVALDLAAERAAQQSLPLQCLRRDLVRDGLPDAKFDLVVCVHFLDRTLYRQLPAALSEGGKLCILQPTLRNLERHERPPAAYLLEPDELPKLVEPLEILDYEAGWTDEGRHEARLIAQRRSD